MNKLKKRFRWNKGRLKIDIVDWDNGTPLGYVWFGKDDKYLFDLNSQQAIILAKNIIALAKKAGLKI